MHKLFLKNLLDNTEIRKFFSWCNLIDFNLYKQNLFHVDEIKYTRIVHNSSSVEITINNNTVYTIHTAIIGYPIMS